MLVHANFLKTQISHISAEKENTMTTNELTYAIIGAAMKVHRTFRSHDQLSQKSA
jgi:hypothetical protein